MFKDYRVKIANSQQLLIQKSKMASMGEMIGNIAHQWRQPLAQLSGMFLDLESAYNYGELNKKYLTSRVAQANDLLEYMSKTIDDFKEFYNPNSKEKRFNIYESIQNAIKIISPALKYHNIAIEVDVDKSLCLKGFSNEFSQVILNIISNSKDIAILRQIKEAKIKIYARTKEDAILIHIEDNCGGIKEDNLDKIFEPYFTTKYDYGTGIGLYMCKVIIENKMGGKIFAKNVTQDLLRFTIELVI
jgi:C4-dicarboxylate-specific signal transduction histidine kinase